MKVYLFIMLAALLSVSGCAPRASSSANNNAGNLSSYKSFAWLPADIQTNNNPKYNGDIIDSKIKSDVEAELRARGIGEVQENQHPDLLLAYHVYTENRQQIYGGYYGGFYPGYGWGGYYGGWGYGGWGYGGPSYYNYTEGTLILDFIDGQSKKVVWRGTVDGDVTNTNKLDKRIDKGVHAIMKEFPVEGDKKELKHPS